MKQSKTGDFFIGFLGILLLDAALYWVLRGDGAWVLLAMIVDWVLFLAAIQLKRPFIGLGIVATIVIPIFACGACVVDVMRNGFH